MLFHLVTFFFKKFRVFPKGSLEDKNYDFESRWEKQTFLMSLVFQIFDMTQMTQQKNLIPCIELGIIEMASISVAIKPYLGDLPTCQISKAYSERQKIYSQDMSLSLKHPLSMVRDTLSLCNLYTCQISKAHLEWQKSYSPDTSLSVLPATFHGGALIKNERPIY